MSPREITARFRVLGWDIKRGTKHDFAVSGPKKVRLPNAHGDDVSVGLISRILKQAGISRSDWLG
jgi:predicted RNA binding protein YcfA (HicA-like mRNA interferase family)